MTMTLQDIFNKVATHLIEQGKPAATELGICKYRTNTGLRCAAGCLIPDELYDNKIENHSVRYTETAAILYEAGVYDEDERDTQCGARVDLLAQLQRIHDNAADKDLSLDEIKRIWVHKLNEAAREHGIENTVLRPFLTP